MVETQTQTQTRESPAAPQVQRKVCSRCKIPRPINEFHRHGEGQRDSRCNVCRKLVRALGPGRRVTDPAGPRPAPPTPAEIAAALPSAQPAPEAPADDGPRGPWQRLSPAEASARLRRYVAERRPLGDYCDQLSVRGVDESED